MIRTPLRSSGRRALAREAKAWSGLRAGTLADPVEHFASIVRTMGVGPGGEKGRPVPGGNSYFLSGQDPSGVTTSGWESFTIPKNARMITILVVGGGAAGGTGFDAAGATGTGGGGGGSGGQAALTIPTRFLPSTLFLLAGFGGLTAAQAGTLSVVSDQPGVTAAQDVVVSSGTAAATGGGNGASTVVGSAGAGSTVALATGAVWSGLGVWNALAGQAGGTGGTDVPGAGASVAWGTTGRLTSGGAGGGGHSASTAAAGGNITGGGLVPTISGGALVAGAAAANNGGNGLKWTRPYIGTGGAGAGASPSGVGAFGGNGGWGGGGGGQGANGASGGGVGQGGPGYVYITWW